MKQNKHLKRWIAFVLAFVLILNTTVKNSVFADAATDDVSIVNEDEGSSDTTTEAEDPSEEEGTTAPSSEEVTTEGSSEEETTTASSEETNPTEASSTEKEDETTETPTEPSDDPSTDNPDDNPDSDTDSNTDGNTDSNVPQAPATVTVTVPKIDHAKVKVSYTGLSDDNKEVQAYKEVGAEDDAGVEITAVKGKDVQVTVTADSGYRIDSFMGKDLEKLSKEELLIANDIENIEATVTKVVFSQKIEEIEYGKTYTATDLVETNIDASDWNSDEKITVEEAVEEVTFSVTIDGDKYSPDFTYSAKGKKLESTDYQFAEGAKKVVGNTIYINDLSALSILTTYYNCYRVLVTDNPDNVTLDQINAKEWTTYESEITLANMFGKLATDNAILIQLKKESVDEETGETTVEAISEVLEIVYDQSSPEFGEVNYPNGWCTDDDGQITGTVADKETNYASGIDSVKYTVDTDVAVNDATLADDGSFTINCTEGIHTYHITAYDKAGNPSKTEDVEVSYDKSVPTLSNISVGSEEEEKDWYSAEYTNLAITGKAVDAVSGIAKVEYYKDDAETATGVTVEEDGTFTIPCEEGVHTYKIVATDNVGKTDDETKNVQYDVTMPEADVYIQYDTDSTEDDIDAEGLLGNIINKLFGKEEITATVFVKDSLSGIASVTVNKTEYTEKIGGDPQFKDTTISAEGYIGFAVKFTASSSSQKVKVEGIKDTAGNVRTEGINGEVLEDTIVLYVDNTSPKLKVDLETEAKIYKDGNDATVYNPESENYKLYFRDDYTPKFTLVEDFYKDPDTGTILGTIESSIDELQDMMDGTKWDSVGAEHTYSSTTLKAKEGEEKEYTLEFSYEDESTNIMVADAAVSGGTVSGGTVSEGTFKSNTIVIDKLNPVISNVTFTGDVQSGNTIYLTNDGNVNVKVEFDITEKYLRDFKVVATSESGKIEIPYNSNDTRITIKENQHCEVIVPIEKDGHWKFTLEATDKSGRSADITKDAQDILNETIVVSDFTAPTLSVSYDKDWKNITDSTKLSAEDKTTVSSSAECFVTEDTSVTFTIKEKNFVNEVFITKIFKSDDNANELNFTRIVPAANFVKATDAEGNEIEDTYTYTLPLTKEGHYQYILTYTDLSDNDVVADTDANDETKNCMTDGKYTSQIITVDKTTPVIKTSFDKEVKNTQSNRDYYSDEKVTMTISITEENFRASDFVMDYTKYKYDGKDESKGKVTKSEGNKIDQGKWESKWVEDENGVEKQTWTTTVDWDASYNYDMKYNYTDLAKQAAKAVSDSIAVDNVDPTITIEKLEGTEACDILFKNKQTGNDFLKFINYKQFAHFAQDKVFTVITAHDDAAGVKEVEYKVLGEDGKTIVEEGTLVNGDDNDDKDLGKWTAKAVVLGADFKGYVQAQAIDRSENKGDIVNPKGVVSETEDKHNETSKLEINTVTAPSRTVGSVNYYNKDVTVDLHIEDNHSGIQSYEYKAGTEVSGSLDYTDDPGSDDVASKEKVNQYTFDKTVVMAAGDTNYTNKNNPSEVNITYTCNAGYTETATEKYVIDDKAPVIEVSWNPNTGLNEKYYKETRTATIIVTERNFDEGGVDWSAIKANNPNGYSISRWTHDGDTHTCTVSFTDDGDYTLGFSITDYATNKTVWNKGEEFTIDKTKPVISITFDNMNVSNGHYFNAARTATLHVEEHNFDAKDISVSQAAQLNNSTIDFPSVGGWSGSEDHHTADIYYGNDGDYTLNFTYTDLAGNEADVIAEEVFTIDQTVPVVEISDLEAPYAYNGTVAPRVTYSDVNMDAASLSVSLVGYMNGAVSYDRQAPVAVANGYTEKWNDFPHEETVDDIYTLKVSVQDMAGNIFSDEALFSVNRFGSTYMCGKSTETNLDKYYNKEEFDVEVIEVNVSELALEEAGTSVQVKDEENQLKDLTEGTDYTLTKGSNEYNWPAYTYVIKKDMFAEENMYSVTFSSVDKATNKMSNDAKDVSVEFVIDKTAPTGVITGLEDSTYETDEHEISVSAMDNYKLDRAVLVVDEQEVATFGSDEFNNAQQMVAYTLKGSDKWQSVGLKVVDAAGNETVVEPVSRLITASKWVQFVNNKPLFYSSIAGVVAVILGAVGVLTKGFGYQASMAAGSGFWFLLFGKRRKEDEEEEQN